MFESPTQLEDISNQVAQEKIGDQRLRNEAIRERMANPWTAPTTQASASQPSTLTDVYNTPTGTLASTYSGLKNNYNTLNSTMGSTTPNTNSTYLKSDAKLPSWAPGAANTTASILGAGPYSGLAGIATNLVGGNKEAALKGAESWGLNTLFNKAGLGEYSGLATTLGMGLLGDKSMKDIGMDLGNAGIGKILAGINPVAGGLYGLARMFGFDPMYGMNNQFGNGMEGVAPGFGGTAGGFFGKNAIGSGISNTTNPTPAGYAQGDLGTGISTGAGLGYKGSSSPSSSSSGWGTNAGYSTSGNSNYSSYGGSGYSSSSDSGDD